MCYSIFCLMYFLCGSLAKKLKGVEIFQYKIQNVKRCELSLQQLFIGILQIQRLCHNLFIMLYMIIRNFVNIKLSDILLLQTMFRYLSPVISEWLKSVYFFPPTFGPNTSKEASYLTYLRLHKDLSSLFIDLIGLLVDRTRF